MKKVPSEAGEIHKYNYRVVNNKMMDFEENFFLVPAIKKEEILTPNNKVLVALLKKSTIFILNTL